MDAAHELIWCHSYGAVRVDTICERARVKKGTFYHFFDSKPDLVVASIHAWWDERRHVLKECFQSAVPPLSRIANYIDFVAHGQLLAYEKTGRIPGCPVFTLASEICTQDGQIATLVREILEAQSRNFEQAIRDAQVAGEIAGGTIPGKAKLLWAVYEGTLSRARIENNPDLVRNLSSDALEAIGGRQSAQPLATG